MGDGAEPAEGPARSRTSSELALRILSGIVLAAAVLGATFWGGLPFALIWAVAAGGVAYEWQSLTDQQEVIRQRARAVALLVAAAALALHLAGALVGGLLIAAAALLAGIGRNGSRAKRAARIAGVLYAAVIAIVPVAARQGEWGLLLVLWIFAVVWTTDVLAYACGRLIGGPKLWPRVSPKKTWSGFLGGVATGAFAGWLVAGTSLVGGPAPFATWIILVASAVAAIASQAGDLAESALKRRVGVKDTGSIIPGHGGLMDRLDSFWAVSLLVGLGLLIQLA
ncbi:phosphatidate cytidylyltransferase [Chelatococcus sp. GCM10030263]|uniref:phosphatidate cytidylyltransferase n=1 Tax=Chelatococcus sp. GCM10030263 TaxID=3273387 RepID=UPI003619E3AB